MNKKFTKLIAALALLVFMTPTMAGWGQTAMYSLTPDQQSTGSTATTYITTMTEFSYNSISWKMNQWNPSTLQIKCNQSSAASEFRFYNTSAIPGRITQVVITFSALTVSDANKLMFLGGTSEVSATTGGTAGTWNSTEKTLTWTPSSTDNFTYFAFYQNGKAASGSNYLNSEDAIVVTYETGGGSATVATPVLSKGTSYCDEAQSITMTCDTEGATIHYTLDGSEPTSASTTYSGAISITETTTLRAIAIKDGESSAEASATYTFVTTLKTMEAIFNAATTPASQVYIHFNNWVITGNNGNNSTLAYLTDGTNGCIIYGSGHGFVAGNVLNGVVSCTLGKQSGMARLENLTVSTSGLDVTTGGTVTPVETTINALSAINTGSVATIQGLTYNGTTLTDGTNTIKYSTAIYGGTSLVNGNTYDITGVIDYDYSGIRINPRNAADVVIGPATLPFNWAGGGKSALMALQGVTTNGLGTDYSSSTQGVYQVRLDDTGDYIMVRTDSQPNVVTIGVKMIGGNTSSTITVQASTDGVNFDAGQDLTISGAQNTIVELTSTRTFDADVRYVKLYFTKGANVGVGPISITKVSTEPSITVADASIAASADNCTMAITYQNVTISDMSDFTVVFCDAEGNDASQPEWITEALVAEENGDYMVSCTFDANTGSVRTAYLKVVAGETTSNVATLTQAAYVPTITYTLAASIENGRHYIITNGSDKAMGGQNTNNRAAVDVEITDGVATVTGNNVCEVVINGPDADGFYTIYDAAVPGYLFAAGGTGSNYLKTQPFNDNKGQWTISFDAETNAAIIVANISGTNARNTMKYNSNNDIFSCYSGGQNDIYLYVKNETTPQYDFYMDIAKWTTGASDKWYFIASPLASAYTLTGTNMVSGTYEDYDLYRLNNTTWENYNNTEHSDFTALNNGTGYLYANSSNTTLHFSGAINTFTTDNNANVKNLSAGWNLIGNPYSITIYINKPYYKMNAAGDAIETEDGITSVAIPACTGVIVNAGENETVTFSTTAPSSATGNQGNIQMTLAQQANNRGTASTLDNAIVSFNEGSQLEKFYFMEQNANLYIPQNNEEYAIVNAEAQGEMPVNFRANENGQYTLTVNPENVEMGYLHLIDNMTGADIDLLATPSYSFEAKTTDSESRFRLVFSANSNKTESDSFAFFSNGQLIINSNGQATLQVIDLTGRLLSSETINGTCSTTLNAPAGVYMIRLVNGENVKVQKIVVR